MLRALPLSHSCLFHLGILHEPDSTSNPAVIKQHPWVHPNVNNYILNPFWHDLSLLLSQPSPSPIIFVLLSLETSFSFTCFTLNHSFPFILILIIPLNYHFYSLISIFCSPCLLFFPSLFFFSLSLSSSITLFKHLEPIYKYQRIHT